MKTTWYSIVLAGALAVSGVATAGSSTTYQVTGPVLEANDSMIAVQKGKERWEVARDASTKADAEVTVGDKVTITYTMTATKIENKGGVKAEAKGSASPSPAKK